MSQHTILVVDDEPASVRAVARTLGEDYRVITASSGAQALALLAHESIALMIVDQRMPEMSGTEVLARSALRQPEVIRVLLTGYTDVETLVDAINAGHVYYYVTKPWEPPELRLVVRRGLERYDVEADRRRLMRALEQAYSRTRRAAERKGRLLALAAHELGTPLHVLSNALALVADAQPAPGPRLWLETAQRSTERLARVLAQMVRAGRWGGRRFALHRRPVDVPSLLAGLQATFQPIVAARHLALRVDIASGLPALCADRVWLDRALSNLVSNAVRFTPDGGQITITATATHQGLTLTVTDTGVGIDANLLDEVFEPFSAACGDVSLHTSGRFEFGSQGLGLGLAVTKAIVDRHGGTVSVRSQRGIGSEFTIHLPFQPATAGTSP
ncbi:MAG: ATP-binding protein [Candidatus Binatia bacterium]